jgi:ATP adenylyltransferase/5',5'''-P-1,P-4-tetraphosphate phosphorylase II
LLFAINEGAKKVAAASVLRSTFLFFIKANSLAFCGFLLVSQLQVLLVPETSMFLVLQQVPFCAQARLLKIRFS